MILLLLLLLLRCNRICLLYKVSTRKNLERVKEW